MYERMKALYELSRHFSRERYEDDTHSLYVRRRRAWLWNPLALGGVVMLVWQVTSWEPVPALVLLGLGMCIPWMADV